MKKKLLLGIMCLLVAAISVTAVACSKKGGGEKPTEGLLYTYNARTGLYQVSVGEAKDEKRIVIPDTYKGTRVTAIADSGFAESAVESIVLPASVTSIGSGAFADCSNLTSITIPSSVTSIGSGAFADCSNLTSITIPSSVTSIGIEAFLNCDNLQPSIAANNAKYLGNSGNPYLYLWEVTDKSITDFTIGERIAFIDYEAFTGCDNLRTVNWNAVDCDVTVYDRVPSYFASTVFYNCQSPTTVNIGESVKTIPYGAFAGCKNLQPSITENNAKYLGNSGNPYLYLWEVTDKTITNFTINERTKIIGYEAFGYVPGGGCGNLTSITIPANVISIGGGGYWGAFYDCANLQTVTFAGESKLESIGELAFSGCRKLAKITLPASVTSIGNGAFSNCDNLQTVTFVGDSKLEAIGISAFRGCSNLTSITLPASVTSIDNYAFEDCSNLTSITLPASVTSIGYEAFNGCSSLNRVNITDLAAWCNIDFGGSYANPLSYAHNLYVNGDLRKEINIPQKITEIKAHTFEGCNATSITIHEGVTAIGGSAFSDCSNLTSIIIPASVTSIGVSIGGGWDLGAFQSCTNLQIVTFAGNSKLESIGGSAFSGCDKLTSIALPASVADIGNYAFWNCSGLTSITIPSNVTSIGYMAFSGCDNLQRATFANPVGWKVSKNSDMSDAKDISSSDLQDETKAAQYLCEDVFGSVGGYSNYYWKRV